MSGSDLILNFILGVLASYLAAEIRERPQYIYLTLKSLVDMTKGLCYRVSFKISSLSKLCVVLAGTKLTALTMSVRSSPLPLFITLTFLLAVVAPFKAGKELELLQPLDQIAFSTSKPEPPRFTRKQIKALDRVTSILTDSETRCLNVFREVLTKGRQQNNVSLGRQQNDESLIWAACR